MRDAMENGPRFVLRRSRSRGRVVVATAVGVATVAGLAILGLLAVLRAGTGSGFLTRGDALARLPVAGHEWGVPDRGGGGSPPDPLPPATEVGSVEDPQDAPATAGGVPPPAEATSGRLSAETVVPAAPAAPGTTAPPSAAVPVAPVAGSVETGTGVGVPPSVTIGSAGVPSPSATSVDKIPSFNVTAATRPPLVCRGVLKFPRTSEEGWYFCDAPSLRNGLVYTVGVGRNIRWDEAMIKEFNTTHHGFDPTPRSTSFFLDTPSRLPPGFFFHPMGLGVTDGELAMELPDGNTDSFVPSALGLAGGKRHVTVPVRTLSTLLANSGHSWVDVLKVDIEGAEGDVVQSWADAGSTIPADQVLLELHGRYFPGATGRTFATTVVQNMQRCGFTLFYQTHFEYSFVRSNSVDATGTPVAEFSASKKLR
ncbi:hypothetical protein MMPV_008975 [Pyropia vietnamensis]